MRAPWFFKYTTCSFRSSFTIVGYIVFACWTLKALRFCFQLFLSKGTSICCFDCILIEEFGGTVPILVRFHVQTKVIKKVCSCVINAGIDSHCYNCVEYAVEVTSKKPRCELRSWIKFNIYGFPKLGHCFVRERKFSQTFWIHETFSWSR